MSGLFGSPAPAADTAPDLPSTSLRVQTSIEGKARARIWGQTRVPGNLIWYGDFYAVAQASSNPATSGGKGGLFGQPAAPPSSSGYNYFTSLEMALCEGPVAAIGPRMWASKAITDLSTAGLVGFIGTNAQVSWSYLTAKRPDVALGYRLTSYVAGNVALGSSAELPNWTIEVTSAISNAAPGIVDASMTAFIADFLANPICGVAGWSAAFNGDWTDAHNYTVAASLFFSYALTDQTSAQSFLAEVIESANLMPVWSDAQLKLVPLGDSAITANGVTYLPPTAPVYDLDDSDFLPNQSSFGGINTDPVSGQRKSPRDQNNVVKVEWLNRVGDYNPALMPATDDGARLLYGDRGSNSVRSWHWFQTSTAASMAAQLALGREQISNEYAFTLRPRYILLDPGDIVSVTDELLGLERQWVRVLDVQENQDRSLNFLVEEFLDGTGAAPIYGRESSQGSIPDYNADPGIVNPPIIFEPTDQLAGGLQVWAAVSGVDLTLYGGCDAWVSYDGVTYSRVPGGRIYGSSRMGKLTAALPAFPINLVGPTLDNTNIIQVDLTESAGELLSASATDLTSLNTACYVGGEIVAYQTADLVGSFKYNLSKLSRNAFGTEDRNVLHPLGTDFARLDNSIIKIPFDAVNVGKTIFIKFVPFNVWGGGPQDLASAAVFTYNITGSALASPLPTLQNVKAFFDQQTGTTQIGFDEVVDFRTDVRYEFKKGATLESALSLGTRAHPPFPSFGNGTYWLSAVCQPLPGLTVHSEQWVSIQIAGSTLVSNVIATRDEAAESWPGIFTGTVGKSGIIIRTGGSGNILVDPDFLNQPDILNAGGQGDGTYEIPVADYIDAGRLTSCRIIITWVGGGQVVTDDMLSNPDILNNPDFLASSSSAFVEVFPDVSFTITPNIGDVFALDPTKYPGNDIFAPPDVFSSDLSFTPWQKYEPGVYTGRVYRARLSLSTIDLQTAAIAQQFIFSVDIPDRLDTWGIIGGVPQTLNQVTAPAGGLVITFASNGQTIAEAFNGGPGTDAFPLIQITNTSNLLFDFEVTAISKTGCTIVPRLAGVPTDAPKTNISIQGW